MMVAPTRIKRIVYHIGGYDPITPQDATYSRFGRELGRFQRTWSVTASVSPARLTEDEMWWPVVSEGIDWRVETEYHFVRWDDVITAFGRAPLWRRVAEGVLSFFDFLFAGALWRYLRLDWHYAGFFLYPFLVFFALATVAVAIAAVVAAKTASLAGGMAGGLVAVAALFLGPWRWLHLADLFDDWIFSRAYIRSGNQALQERLDRIAAQIVATMPQSGADEIVFVGHSLGAVLAIDLIDRILTLNPSFGQSGPRVAFLSVGSSILKIGLHRGAKRFRAAVQRVGLAAGVFWGDFQARIDIMNFYNTEPMTEMSLVGIGRPVVRLVEIGRMLEHEMYRRIRLRFFRIHCQFISGNDRRAAYDYFMLICGPFSAESQTLSDDGAMSMMQEDGSIGAARSSHLRVQSS